MIPLSDSEPAGKFPLWVIVIIAINAFLFYLEITSQDTDLIIRNYALIPNTIDFSNWQTLTPFVTSQFLHGGFLHIISNMLFLWVFGDNIEAKFGNYLFPIFYIFSGIVAGLSQYIFIPDSSIPMIGASGAVAGVLGAYFALFPKHRIKTLIPIFGFFTITELPASLILIYWFVIQLISGTFSIGLSTQDLGGIAYFAHIGGFIVGYIFAQLLRSREYKH